MTPEMNTVEIAYNDAPNKMKLHEMIERANAEQLAQLISILQNISLD